MKTDAGVTRKYISDDAPNPIAEAEDKEGAGMKHRAFAFGRQDRTAYRVEGVGKNPLIWPFSPYINYGFTIEVDNCRKDARIDTGRHDGYPSYEVFVRLPGHPWINLYHYDAKKEGATPWQLLGRGDVTVRDTRPQELL